MSLNFVQQQRLIMIDALTQSVIQSKETISNIARTFGSNYAEIIQGRLNALGHTGNCAAEKRGVIMRQKRERNELAAEHAKERTSVGMLAYSPKQEVFTTVVREHLDGCESGDYPTATKTAQAVVGDKSTKLLAKTGKKNLSQAFADNKEHPGMKRIKNLVSNSTITAASSGTVSTCLGALVDAHKLARVMDEQQRRTQVLETRLAIAEAAATLANTRLDIKDSGRDWKEAARAIRAVEPGITNTALGNRVGKSEGAIRKYLTSMAA
jgi:hypothetical protein